MAELSKLEELQSKIPRGLPHWPLWLAVLVCGVLACGALVLDLVQPLGVAGGVPYIAIVLIASFANHRLFAFAATLTCILLVVLGFYLAPVPEEPTLAVLNRTQAIAVMALIATFLIHRIGVMQLRDAALQELSQAIAQLKLLHGMLPICANCKKIKTETGDWALLESYMQAHAEVEFTHGICNDCAERIYGEVLRDRPAPPPEPKPPG